MINAGEQFLSAHINTGVDLGEVTEICSYCFQGSTTCVGAFFRRCWVVDILLWGINHQWNGWNWKKENLGWRLLLSRQYNYSSNPYLRGKQVEMLSSRRKQLMLLRMNMLIYFASNMISRNYMKLLELDNVADEERLLLSRQYNYCRNPYLRGKQEEMLSSRRKQLMLLEMSMLIYFASKMINRNYMKLFELDNIVDEERFTMAVETPPLPTLPNFELHEHHLYRKGDSQFFIERENSMPCHLFDVMVLEVHCSNSSKMKASSGAFCDLLSCGMQDSDLIEKQVEGKFTNCDSVIFSDGKSEPTTAIQQLSGGSDQTYLSSSANIREKDNMSRILICSKNKFTNCDSVLSSDGKSEPTSAIHQLSGGSEWTSLSSANIGCSMDDDFLSCLECFTLEINRSTSDKETKSLFQETCQLDILVRLIKDFPIEDKF